MCEPGHCVSLCVTFLAIAYLDDVAPFSSPSATSDASDAAVKYWSRATGHRGSDPRPSPSSTTGPARQQATPTPVKSIRRLALPSGVEDLPEEIDPFDVASMTPLERARLVARVVKRLPLAELAPVHLLSGVEDEDVLEEADSESEVDVEAG